MKVKTQDIQLLFKRYNALLVECRALEESLDNKIEPYCEQELKVTQIRRLTKDLNKTIQTIKDNDYIPSEDEVAHGFSKAFISREILTGPSTLGAGMRVG